MPRRRQCFCFRFKQSRINHDTITDDIDFISLKNSGGAGGSEVWLYEIVGGKHAWGEQDIDTGEELWKFFSRFVK